MSTPDVVFGFVLGFPAGMFLLFVFTLLVERMHPAISDAEVRQRLDSAQKCVDLAGQHLSIVRNREAKKP